LSFLVIYSFYQKDRNDYTGVTFFLQFTEITVNDRKIRIGRIKAEPEEYTVFERFARGWCVS